MVHSGRQPQTRRTKLASIRLPDSQWLTSGWNWMPKSGLLRCRMAAGMSLSLTAKVSKPGARASIESPWLIQLLKVAATPSNSGWALRTRTGRRPYSRSGKGCTRPPPSCVMRWAP